MKKIAFLLPVSLKSTQSRTSHTNSVWESAMEGANNRNSDALFEKVSEDSEALEEREGGNRDEKVEKIDEQRRASSDTSTDCAVRNSSRGESKASQFQTLAPMELSGGDFRADFDDSSDHLSEVPVEYSLQPLQTGLELKDQVKALHKVVSKDIGGKCSPSATKSTSSVASSNLPEQKLQPVKNGRNVCVPEQDKQNSKRLSIVPTPRTPSDGYNWRKYGQKQVKSPEGSRSYYRCTFSDCHAKKIECCDISSRLIETVYRSHHNHEPPQKLNSARENKPVLSTTPINGSKDSSHLVRPLNDPVPSTPSKEQVVALCETPETKQESSGSDETTGTNSKGGDGPESKKRQKRNTSGEVESLPKPGKKPKYVVHAAGDVGISGDGYRWRKYGQKMVKGNPHPRNYYRCTSAGCPVRKHIERAVDNSNAVVITYKGIHDHDTPVPRKRHGPKSGITTVATSPISLHDMQNKSKPHKSQQTQWSVGKEGELTGDALVGGDKASESARTLLSVGFEIKPC